jgi:hypothetical protein
MQKLERIKHLKAEKPHKTINKIRRILSHHILRMTNIKTN